MSICSWGKYTGREQAHASWLTTSSCGMASQSGSERSTSLRCKNQRTLGARRHPPRQTTEEAPAWLVQLEQGLRTAPSASYTDMRTLSSVWAEG